MTFTSSFFLIGILPVFVILYRLAGKSSVFVRSLLFLLANTLFLVWGGAGSLLFLCAFAVLVWLLSILVSRVGSRWALALSLVLTAAPLVVVKYKAFLIRTVNAVTGSGREVPSLFVPTGISFVTFEAVSLLVDLYRGKIEQRPSLVRTYLYLTFFPTVTSGPIIRFGEFEGGLRDRMAGCDYAAAMERIAVGLCKKVLIADKMAYLADYYFDGTALGNSYSCIGLWIGSIAYTLQLYYDFSGYSDMAVGIGQLLGFRIRENFNAPYQAASISDFWNRWHMSLTQWFRDYVYIPLGGNRCSAGRHILNMLAVWLLTGIWHGADWTFILWGLGYFVLLTGEKYLGQGKKQGKRQGEKRGEKPGINIIGHLYTLFFVNLLWVPFRASGLGAAGRYVRGMFGGGTGPIEEKAVHFLPFLAVAVLLCLPWKKLLAGLRQKKWFQYASGALLIVIVFLAVCAMVNSSYAPYIYGNF